MKFRKLAGAVAGIVLLAAASVAQTSRIEGDVIGLDGKPLAKAVVKLERTDVKQNYETKTDNKGHFLYMGLPVGGTFTVSILVDDKVVDFQAGVKGASSGTPLKFDLAKAKENTAARDQAMSAAAQSGNLAAATKGLSGEEKAAVEAALKQREEAMKKNKELNDAFTAGMTAIEAKNWPEAVAKLELASTLDVKQTAVWCNLGDAEFGLATTKTGAERDALIQKGIDAYGQAITLKPTEAGFHNNFGRGLASVKKYAEAQAEIVKAAALDPPGAGKYYYNLGAIMVNAGSADSAVEAFKKAIETDPNYADAYYQYGVSLMSKAQISADGKITPVAGTNEAFQKYLSLAPDGPYAQPAKDMLTTLGATVETRFSDPNAKKSTTTTKKK